MTARLLVFSRTLGFRHDSIAAGIAAFERLGRERGFRVTASEDPALFADATLREFDVLVFLSTTGDVLEDAQRAAMQRFIQRGNGFVGVHSASDTECDWGWYGKLVGAYFRAHPAVQAASIIVENSEHQATRGLPSPWRRIDEWYAFRSNPRGRVDVLLRLDEGSYAPGEAGMGADHPLAWAHEFDGGRAFYTGLGHTKESFEEPELLAHLGGAVEWAAGISK
jgi:cytochrome c